MKKIVLIVLIVLIAGYVYSAETVYRSVDSADSVSPAVIPLSDQRGVADTYVQVNPYGGDNGGEVNDTNYTPSITLTMEICHDASATTDPCINPTFGFSGTAAGSTGAVFGPYRKMVSFTLSDRSFYLQPDDSIPFNVICWF